MISWYGINFPKFAAFETSGSLQIVHAYIRCIEIECLLDDGWYDSWQTRVSLRRRNVTRGMPSVMAHQFHLCSDDAMSIVGRWLILNTRLTDLPRTNLRSNLHPIHISVLPRVDVLRAPSAVCSMKMCPSGTSFYPLRSEFGS